MAGVALRLLILAGCTSIFLAGLSANGLPGLAISLSLIVAAMSWVIPNASLFLIGLAIPTAGFFQQAGVSLLVAAALSGEIVRRFGSRKVLPNSVQLGCTLFAAAIIASAARTFVLDVDVVLLRNLYSFDGFQAIRAYLNVNDSSWYHAAFATANTLLLLLLIESVGGRAKEGRTVLVYGLGLGAFCAVLWAAGQASGIGSTFVMRGVDPFWAHTGRVEGLFSDPNALGVSAALLIPLFVNRLIHHDSKVLGLVAAGLFLIGFLSGSRTFFLGLILWGLVIIWQLTRDRSGFLRVGIFLAVCTVCVGTLFVAQTERARVFRDKEAAAPVARLLRTLDVAESEWTFESRLIYAKLAADVWTRYPLVGAGLGRFRDEQMRAAREQGIELGSWWDNANNFYLHVLAEQGLFGALLTLGALGLLAFWITRFGNAMPGARLSLGLLPLLLVTGPHFEFSSVLFLTACLLGLSVGDNDFPPAPRLERALLLVIISIVIAATVLSSERPRHAGLYPVEQHGTEQLVWTGTRARVSFCKEAPPALMLRAPLPGVMQNPQEMRVNAYAGNGERIGAERVISLTEPWTEVPLSPNTQFVTLAGKRTWRPDDSLRSGDRRVLALQLKWPAEACEWKNARQ